jgi:MFS family permease
MMKFFAWAGFIAALIAGPGLAATNPKMMQILIVLGALIALIVDIAKDKIPNQYAVLVALGLPSLLVGMSGGFANTVGGWLTDLWNWASQPLGDLAGTSAIFTAIIVGAVAVLVGQKTMARTSRG